MSKIKQAFVTLFNIVSDFFYNVRGYDTATRLAGQVNTLKDGAIEYPGYMAFSTKGGEYFHGCRVGRFASAEELNAFFSPGGKGFLKIAGEIVPQHDGSLVVVYTNRLSSEDMEDVDEFNRNMNQYFADKKQQRENARAAQREEEAKQQAQLKSDAALGKKYRERVATIKSSSIGKERDRLLKEVNAGSLLEEKDGQE